MIKTAQSNEYTCAAVSPVIPMVLEGLKATKQFKTVFDDMETLVFGVFLNTFFQKSEWCKNSR